MPETKELRDDDFLLIILSGRGEGRFSISGLRRVLYEEEHPQPTMKNGKEVKVDPHPLIDGRFLTNILRQANKSFYSALTEVVVTGTIESIGYGEHYLVYSTINQWAERAKLESGISDDHYSYLRNLGKKLR